MRMHTFGEKPTAFQLEAGGDYYYIGSEVCFLLLMFFFGLFSDLIFFFN